VGVVAHAGDHRLTALPPMRLRCGGTTAVSSPTLKWLPYAWLGLIDVTNMLTALVLAPCAALGVWFGVSLLRRLPPIWFYRLVSAGLLITGLKLTWDGLR
jgi:uncharacterized membrane protein YfcA